MNEERFNALKAKQDLITTAVPYSQIYPAQDVKSEASLEQTLAYDEQQSSFDFASNMWNAYWNGMKQNVRGLVKLPAAIIEANIERNKEYDPNFQPYGSDVIADFLNNVAQSEYLQAKDVRVDNASEQFLFDVTQGLGQMTGQAVAKVSPGVGTAMMFASIMGNQYADLREQGVGAQRALASAFANAGPQTMLEKISLGKVFSASKAKTLTSAFFKDITERAATEAVTEFAQQYPEAISNIYATNEGKSLEEMAKMFIDDFSKITKEAIYSGAVGGVVGGSAGSVVAAVDSRYQNKVKTEVVKGQLEQEEQRIEQIKKSGVNPKYAENTINNNLQDKYVYVDGETLFQYANKNGAEKVADSLGTTMEEITKAKDDGGTVEIKQGTFEVACANDTTLFQTVKEHIAFDSDGEDLFTLTQQAVEIKTRELEAEAQEALDVEMANIRKSMDTALIPKAQADELEVLLTARAMAYNPENPAQWFKDHPLEFTRNGIVGDGYNQIAYHGTSAKNVERLSTDYVGSRNANIYGWGLYFGSKETANAYTKPVLDNEEILATKLGTFITDGGKWINKNTKQELKNNTLSIVLDCLRIATNDETHIIDIDFAKKLLSDYDFRFKNEDEQIKAEKILNDIAKSTKFSLGAKTTKGELFKADIPEDDMYYDWDKPVKEQKEQLKQALLNEGFDENDKGFKVYGMIRAKVDSAKAASLWFKENGVLGFKVEDPDEGMTYVVFDDNVINVIDKQTYYQNNYNQQAKGQINFNSGKSIINFFEKADASTVIHETGHYFVEALAQDVALGRANEQAVKDWNALLEYCGITQAEWDKGGETRVKAHERLAEGFETYLMEGKAPSPKLRKVFAKFAKWLKAVYRKIRRSDNAVDLTDEVREVFDRMLASDEMIAEQARINGIFAKLPKVITDNLSEKQNAFLMSMIEKARETATTLLVKDSLRNFSQERREEIAKYREANEASVKELLMNNPLYAASDSLENYLGTKQKAKTIARKYQNAEGKMYADWQAELKAVQADIADRFEPIISTLEEGMGKGVSLIDYTEDMSGRKVRASNNAEWYSEWYKSYGRKPNKAELKDLAYGVYTGTNDVLGYWSTAGLNLSEAEYAEMEAEQQQLKAEIDELLARETELQEQKESVKPFSHKGLNAEQRENFDVIAETFGFASGDDLAKQILEKPTFNEAVNAYLDNMVQQKYPDIYKERRLAEKAAKEDLYNEDMGAVIGLELELVNEAMEEADAKQKAEALKALNKQAKAEARKRTNEELGKLAKARNQQAKAAAQYALARMPIREAIRVDKYINAERKCAVKAAEAMGKKDFARAQGYKQQQLYNHACVREAMRLRKRFEQHQKYLHKQSKAKRDTWYREEFFNQAGALFARMGITLKGYDATMNTQTLQEFVDWANAEYDNADIADWIVKGIVDISTPKNLTFSEYEDVVNAFKNIKALARLAKGQNAFNSQKEFEEWKAEALENLGKLKTKWKADVNKTKEISFAEKYLRMLTNADAFFEKMDNDQTGFFTKWIYETAKMAQDKEAEMVMRYEQRKREAYKNWLPTNDDKKEASKMHRYEELGGTEVNKHNLINMLIYLTTKSSSDKLCSTAQTSTYFLHFRNSSLWVEGDVEATRENILEFLSQHLTEADIEYAQAKVDAANMFWEELEALEKRTKGFRPNKEEAYPATLIINGKEVRFTGGYIPLVRDRQAGSRPKSQEAIRGLEDDKPGANIRTLHTNTGSTKARDASVYPLDLTEGFEDGAVMDTIHDICFRELMSDYRRMFNDAEMYQTLKEKLGEADLQSLEEYARSVAQPYGVGGYSSLAGKDMGGWLSTIRRKAVYFAIMGKFSTVFQNVGNILLYGNNVEGFTHKDSFIAMANWRKQVGDNGKGFKAMREFVTEKSVFMRERMEIPDISLRQIRDEKAKPNIVEQKAVEFGTKMLVYTDNITALPVWIHAYNKQMQAGMSEQEAINFADTVIRRTLGSSRKSDVAPMFRDDSLKLFTVFQSFFNTQFNQWAREFRLDSKLIKNGEYTEAAKNIAAFAGAKFIAANMLSLILTATNPFADDDEDDYMNITKSLLTYPLQMAGPAGTIATVALQNAIGMKNYGYRITPAQSAFDTVIRTSKQAYKFATGKGEFEDLAEASSNMFGMFYGVPQQFSILFWNGYDIFVNDMDLQGSDIFRRRPVKER